MRREINGLLVFKVCDHNWAVKTLVLQDEQTIPGSDSCFRYRHNSLRYSSWTESRVEAIWIEIVHGVEAIWRLPLNSLLGDS